MTSALTSRIRVFIFTLLGASYFSCLASGQTGLFVDIAHCGDVAQEAYENCMEEGGTDERCRGISDEIMALCPVPPGPPDVPPECDEICSGVVDHIFNDCMSNNADQEACQARADEFQTLCLGRCDAPRPPTCESLCKMRATFEAEACKRRGGVAEECEAAGEAVAEACIDRCGMDGDGNRPPSIPPLCEDRCAAAAERVEASCVAGGGDADACDERGTSVLENCLRGCNEVPAIPCSARCRVEAHEGFKECVTNLQGDADEDGIAACRSTMEILVEECAAECDPPEPPRACVASCALSAEETKRSCVDGGNDPDECAAEAHLEFNSCVETECERPQPPPCEDRCQNRVGAKVQECIDAGGNPEECAADVEGMVAECLEQCGTRPEPLTCEERCESIAGRAFDECLLDENSEDECRGRMEDMLERCLLRCSGEFPVPPECGEKCQQAGERVLEGCIADGGDPEECEATASHVRERCASHCERPHPAACPARCIMAAREERAECLADGGSPEECDGQAEEVVKGCLDGCEVPRPERPNCEDRCATAQQMVLDACINAGGTTEDCEAEAADFASRCVDECDHGLPPSCQDRCSMIGERVFADCVGENGTDDECRGEADSMLEQCLLRCEEKPTSCAEGCAERARDEYSVCLEGMAEEIQACVDAGGVEGRCRAAAIRNCKGSTNEFLSGCILENCRPAEVPVRCEDRCSRAAAVLQQQCEERDGDTEECAAEAEELLALCQQNCNDGVDLPPCDSQCEDVALKIKEGCMADGNSEADCDALASRFEENCKQRLAAVCDRELGRHTRAPIAFMRGDVNRDEHFDSSDVIEMLQGLFLGKPNALDCEDAADLNDNGKIDIGDAVFGLVRLFRGGQELPSPTGLEGHDSTLDELLCNPPG